MSKCKNEIRTLCPVCGTNQGMTSWQSLTNEECTTEDGTADIYTCHRCSSEVYITGARESEV